MPGQDRASIETTHPPQPTDTTRCMVQDTFDPEFYLDVYETAFPDGTRNLRSGR
jgi:hypothetical protein